MPCGGSNSHFGGVPPGSIKPGSFMLSRQIVLNSKALTVKLSESCPCKFKLST